MIQNPYAQSFRLFLRDMVWTIDEAAGGRVAKFPMGGPGPDGRSWDVIWDEMCALLMSNRRVFLEKSRRVLASWCVCALDVWLASGGRDPAWTNEQGESVLLNGNGGNRTIILAAQRAEGEFGSEWYIERRIRPIIEQIKQRGLNELWPTFPAWEFRVGAALAGNGSRIIGVAQGSHQLRGGGATQLHLEEVAFWDRLHEALAGAMHTIRGGGHVVAITTACAGSDAKMIRDGGSRRSFFRAGVRT